MIEDVVARHVAGREPFHIEATWRDVYASGYAMRPDPTLMGVLSGIEMAMWDLAGKAVGKPAYELLGGRVRERLRTLQLHLCRARGRHRRLRRSRTWRRGARRSTPRSASRRSSSTRPGPTRPSIPASRRSPISIAASATSRQIREAVGSRCDLLFGTHGQFTVSGAIRLARRLERFDPLWFEEPTPPESPEEMARVARATSIPIATGERLTTKYEFARVLETGAASILQMNLGRVGGLLEGKKIAGMAECHYAQIAPHLYCGPVVGAANIQLATCTPNFLILEGIGRWDGIHADLLKQPIRWEDGYVHPADRARPRRRARRGRRARPSLQRVAPASRGRAGRAPRARATRRERRLRRPRQSRPPARREPAARRLPAHACTISTRQPWPASSPPARAQAASPRAVAEASDCVITCLPSPACRERGRLRDATA